MNSISVNLHKTIKVKKQFTRNANEIHYTLPKTI